MSTSENTDPSASASIAPTANRTMPPIRVIPVIAAPVPTIIPRRLLAGTSAGRPTAAGSGASPARSRSSGKRPSNSTESDCRLMA